MRRRTTTLEFRARRRPAEQKGGTHLSDNSKQLSSQLRHNHMEPCVHKWKKVVNSIPSSRLAIQADISAWLLRYWATRDSYWACN